MGFKSFKGNKAALPSKICIACGREMTWRKSWAKNWADVKFCSDACRANRGAAPAATETTGTGKKQ
jgi:hypothetical protein